MTDVSVPLPPTVPAPASRRTPPTPVLRLRAEAAQAGPREHPVAYAMGVARLAFDYAGGRRLPAATGVLPAAEAAERDRTTELAAWERLVALGLSQIEELAPLRGAAPGALQAGDWVLDRGREQAASADQFFALAPRLRDAGFRLEFEESFPYQLLDEPRDWFVDVEERGRTWFDLRLGIDIDGERVDLLPILRRLLADPAFPLAPRKGEPADATWLVPLDARRRALLPLARLRRLIAPLLEWLQQAPLRGRDDHLHLRRAQWLGVEALQQAPSLVWRGGERLRELAAHLRAERVPRAEPSGFGASLRPYQRDGLAWLRGLAEAGLGGVLADDMGLGKTVQVLAHVLDEKQQGRLPAPVLVVAPTSLVANWRDEAQRFVPALRVLVLQGPQRLGLHPSIPQHDLVITTYPLLLRDREALLDHTYSLLVLDEAQAVKNARSQAAKIVRELPARRRLAMTGTPLENHLGELWAQFDAVEPGLLGSEKQFARFYRTPIEKHADAERRERLQRRIAPLLLRRRKDDVLHDLPAKNEILRRVELQGEQRALYETLRLAQHDLVLAELRQRGLAQSGIVVLDALLKLRQACCDPRLVKLDAARGVRESAKLDLLLDLLDGLVAEGRHVLVFSQFTEMLALIAAALDARGLRHASLTGQTPAAERAARVKAFQAGKVPLFLVSLKAGGVGLNLTAADTVIHYDPWWNPAVEAQATDRAHRIGQDKPVFVYKLICADTVEEKIQALQQRKAELAEALLDGGDVDALRFSEDEVAELFAGE